MIESLVEEVKNLIDDIHVEEIDGEVRVSGKTYPVRDRLKALGFQWDSESKEWYYLDPLGKKALAFNHPLPVSFANDVDVRLATSPRTLCKYRQRIRDICKDRITFR